MMRLAIGDHDERLRLLRDHLADEERRTAADYEYLARLEAELAGLPPGV